MQHEKITRETDRQTDRQRQRQRERETETETETETEMDGWMVYCIINGLTITILWVNDDERD